tara:strand:- start:199 stop:558 length:360 start_codon:yes stop_codon:yes gene_type:complete
MYKVKIGTSRVLRIATLDAVLTKIWAVLDTLGKHGGISITILEGPGLDKPRVLVRALDYGRLLFEDQRQQDENGVERLRSIDGFPLYQFVRKYILDGLDADLKHNPNWTVCTNNNRGRK